MYGDLIVGVGSADDVAGAGEDSAATGVDCQGSSGPGRAMASQTPAVKDAMSSTATPRALTQSIAMNVARSARVSGA